MGLHGDPFNEGLNEYVHNASTHLTYWMSLNDANWWKTAVNWGEDLILLKATMAIPFYLTMSWIFSLDNGRKCVLRKYMAAAQSMDNEQLLSNSILTHVYSCDFNQVYWSYTVGKEKWQIVWTNIPWQGIPAQRAIISPRGTVPYWQKRGEGLLTIGSHIG